MYCLGNVIGIGPNPRECLNLIIENNINLVLGNHELYYVRGTSIDDEMSDGEKKHQKWISEKLNNKHKEFLNKCLLVANEKIGKINLSFQHFLLNSNKEAPYPFADLKIINNGKLNESIKLLESDITFIGHEHKAFEFDKNDKKIIDVGSSGCTKIKNTFYTILSIDNGEINVEKKSIIYNRGEFEINFKEIKYPEKEIINKIFF